jgi:hypothetical protein
MFYLTVLWAILWLRQLITCMSQKRSGFKPTLICVGFVVDKVALRLVFLLVLTYQSVMSVSFHQCSIHSHSSVHHQCYIIIEIQSSLSVNSILTVLLSSHNK